MKRINIPLELIDIENGGYHCFLKVNLHGMERHMLLDTGASRTIFDLSLLRSLLAHESFQANEVKATGLGSAEIENFVVNIEHIKLGRLDLYDLEVGALDLEMVNKSYKALGMQPVSGVIGSDLLMRYRAVIDFGKNKLMLRISNSE
ncbi:MAG: aspartyl protease family protein [Bacteroidia bacterium]